MVLRHIRSLLEEFFQRFFIVRDAHGSSGEHVGGAYQDRVTELICRFFCGHPCGYFRPFWLVDIKRIEELRKFVTIFGAIDVLGVCAKYLDAVRREFESKIIRNLAAGTNDSAARLLKFD